MEAITTEEVVVVGVLFLIALLVVSSLCRMALSRGVTIKAEIKTPLASLKLQVRPNGERSPEAMERSSSDDALPKRSGNRGPDSKGVQVRAGGNASNTM
jgi:hypothetical protein